MKILITFCCLLSALSINAQTLKGTLKDARSGEGVPFVNIGVVGKNIGTVSGEDGTFALAVPEGHSNDIIRLSMLGYKDIEVTVGELHKSLQANPVFTMEEHITELEQVIISNKKQRQKLLGNKTESKSVVLGFTSNKLGNEIGMVMKIKRAPTLLKTFTASVASKDNPPVKLRLNFYSVKDGLPDELIINENIIVTVPEDDSKLVVDLTKYNIMVDDDFFVSLEWIESAPRRINFSAGFLGKGFYARQTSHGNWYKVGVVGVGFTVDTVYW